MPGKKPPPMEILRTDPYASHCDLKSKFHNVIDFLSFRCINDLHWYHRDFNRDPNPYFSEGLFTFAKIAIYGIAKYKIVAYLLTHSITSYLISFFGYSQVNDETMRKTYQYIVLPFAISTIRASFTSALDKLTGFLFDGPLTPIILNDSLKFAWKYAFQEDIYTTGWVLVSATAKRKSANQVMDYNSASSINGAPDFESGYRYHHEWLHLIGNQLGGKSEKDNFVAGSYHANTEMIPIETAAKKAFNKGLTVYYKVTVFTDLNSNRANRINVRVNLGIIDRINYNIDAQRGSFSRFEFALLSKFAEAALTVAT